MAATLIRTQFMFPMAVCSLCLVSLTVLLHYEVLRALNRFLPALDIPSRTKLLVVIFSTFIAHVIEMTIYGFAIFGLIEYGGIGGLKGFDSVSLINSMYFSSETFTSLGFGDISPVGPMRLLAGIETLNGLLLIGWSASYVTIAMERFWRAEEKKAS